MSQHVEIEFKNLLATEEFEQIKNHFQIKDEDFVLQENQYFDTPDFQLKQRGCALRIRRKKGKFEFTLKEPNSVGLLETNEILSEQTVATLIKHQGVPKGEIYTRLQALQIHIPSITYFGTLKTWRAEKKYLDGLLVLDRSTYLDKEDFELEYEVTDPVTGEMHFLDLLQRFDIPRRMTDNKIVRFYKEKLRQYDNN